MWERSLLIDAKDGCMLCGMQVQADDISCSFYGLREIVSHEPLKPPGLAGLFLTGMATKQSGQSLCRKALGELLDLAAQREAPQVDEKLFFEAFNTTAPAQAKVAARPASLAATRR